MTSIFKFASLSALALSTLVGCGGDDTGENEPAPRWRSLTEDLPGALFSVTGTAEDDVWVVGADRGNDDGPTIAHFDGSDWEVHASGVESGDLFWVHAFEDGPVYAAGRGGLLLRYAGGSFETLTTPSDQDVWGVWGATADEVWAVGGDPNVGTGFIWRDRGEGFEAVTLDDELPTPSAWYKVWGASDDNVWFCGVGGALLHYDGTSFESVDSGTTRPLLTIHGLPDGSRMTAVGGQFTATLVSSVAGDAWQDVTPQSGGAPPLQTFGVYHKGDEAYSVGMQSTVLHFDGNEWSEEPTGLDLFRDFHAVWIDPTAEVWAVGGQITAPPFTSGTLIHKGLAAPPKLEL
jgi:hypothetical protein